MTRRLIIDLAKCDHCRSPRCAAGCDYYDRSEGEHAMLALREQATFEVLCRRCTHASCILACPFEALVRTDDGIVKRHNLRCVSCKSCAIACPFGTIYMELVPFYSLSYESSCHACLASADDRAPICAASCPEGALEYREVAADEEGIHLVDDRLAARLSATARAWSKEETAP